MTKTRLLKSCQLLLIVNIIFWLLIAFSSLLWSNSHLIIKTLLFVEPVIYFVSLLGIRRRIKTVYLFSIILALGNTILSITDQMGLSDVASLVLSALVFLNLVLIWKTIFSKTEEDRF